MDEKKAEKYEEVKTKWDIFYNNLFECIDIW